MTPSTGKKKTLYVGAFIHSKSLQALEICQKSVIGVNEEGKIVFIERVIESVAALPRADEWKEASIVEIAPHQFFFPGFIGVFPS
jgi:guanine deaminase